MSLYFEVFFACDLKIDVPEDVIKTLKYLTRQEDYPFSDFPKERFFKNEREGWREFLLPPERYQAFPGWSGSELKMMTRQLGNNRSETYYTLSFRRGKLQREGAVTNVIGRSVVRFSG